MPKKKIFSYKTEGLPYLDQGRVNNVKFKHPFICHPITNQTKPNNKSRKAMFINRFK